MREPMNRKLFQKCLSIALVACAAMLIYLLGYLSLAGASSFYSSSSYSSAEVPLNGVTTASSSSIGLPLNEVFSKHMNLKKYSLVNHLIILPCHGIYKGSGSGTLHFDWFMEEFQKQSDDNKTWLLQIEKALDLLQSNENSILIISGGKTKENIGPISESFSYFNLMLQNNLVPHNNNNNNNNNLVDRIILEEYARDSFENLLFSIARFNEVTNIYPAKITIIGYDFKKRRFLENHVKTIKYPLENVNYIGIDPDPVFNNNNNNYSNEQLVSMRKNFFKELNKLEHENALQLFEKDPFGCGDKLMRKKIKRNPYNSIHPYYISNPILYPLLNYCDLYPKLTNYQVFANIPWLKGSNY